MVVVRLVRVGSAGRADDVGLGVFCGGGVLDDFLVAVGGWHCEYPIASQVSL